jgi:two-component system, OmpR family, sensor histidine kinase MtrB
MKNPGWRAVTHRARNRSRSMGSGSLTLRNTLAMITALIAALAIAATVAVVVMMTHLQRTSAELASSVESVRLAEEAEVDLLLHARTDDPLVQRSIEGDIAGRLAEARSYASTPAEVEVLDAARERFAEYVTAARRGPIPDELQQSTYEALEALVNLNVTLSRQTRQSAVWWGELANVIGFGTAGLLALVAAVLVWWLRRRAFQPVFALADTMERYGRGERDVRATANRGPAELRDMAERFNQMAILLGAQRKAQMAFVGGVAHDLRTPLAALATSVELIPPDRPLPPEDRIRRTVELLKRQLARLNRMINDLLDTAKIEAGELDLELGDHDLRALVDQVVELFSAMPSDHEIEVSICEEALPVRCDPLRVEQVVSNLVSNAIKYSPGAPSIAIEVRRDGDDAVVAVRDQGIGISDEDQRKLFEPFQRAGLSKETIPGVGLGLFVVRRIVEAHGGRIELESTRGEGSHFLVRIPLAAPSERVSRPRKRAAHASAY